MENMGWRDSYAKEIIGKHPHKVGAELGVLRGDNSVALLKHLPKLEKLYCVDVWGNMESMAKYIENIKPYKKRVKTLWMKTVEAHMFVEDRSLDFIFIDASHLYRNVIADIVCWVPKVKIGGVISGHDYTDYKKKNDYDVMGAVDKIFPQANIIGSIWWIINEGNKQWEQWNSG